MDWYSLNQGRKLNSNASCAILAHAGRIAFEKMTSREILLGQRGSKNYFRAEAAKAAA
jgi:hypothetical protein